MSATNIPTEAGHANLTETRTVHIVRDWGPSSGAGVGPVGFRFSSAATAAIVSVLVDGQDDLVILDTGRLKRSVMLPNGVRRDTHFLTAEEVVGLAEKGEPGYTIVARGDDSRFRDYERTMGR